MAMAVIYKIKPDPKARPEVAYWAIGACIVAAFISAWVLRPDVKPIRYSLYFLGTSITFFLLPFVVGLIVTLGQRIF